MDMLSRSILALLILIFAQFVGYGQTGFVLKNTRTGKTVKFKAGVQLHYFTKSDTAFQKGRLVDARDSVLIIGKDTVPVASILLVTRPRPWLPIFRTSGVVLMVGGCLIMGDGAFAWLGNGDSQRGIPGVLAGAAMFAIGYIPFLWEGREYPLHSGTEWTYELRK